MNTFLLHVFQTLEREQISYCLMRGSRHLAGTVSSGPNELDVLIQDSHLARASEILLQLGFLPLPSYGYAPHRFFVAYDRHSDGWVKLDIVDQVAYGAPIPVIQTTLAAACLNHRRREGDFFVPSPECELLTLLLHCVLDKRKFADEHIVRLKTVRQLITDTSLMDSLLQRYWEPTINWSRLAQQIDADDWTGLQQAGTAVRARLLTQSHMATVLHSIRVRAMRKLNRWLTSRSPQAVSVAFLAPDGAGKSTLVKAVGEAYPFPVRSIYMGLYQKGQTRSSLSSVRGMGLGVRLLSLWWRTIQASYHQARRRIVLFDRYTYDALLTPQQPVKRGTRWRRWIMGHACPAPDLVILLDAPGDVLYARKGEHSPERLEHQRQQYLGMKRRLPQMKVVDASQEADRVRQEVTSLIWGAQLKRHKPSSESQFGQVVAT